jgi:A1 cistron-splicing factor AAR2
MGPYPLDPPIYFQRWKKLTGYITPGLIRRVLPNNGKVSHLPDTTPTNESNIKDKRLGKEIEREEGMEFTRFDLRKSFPQGASGDEITKWSLDKSWLVRDLLSRAYHNGKDCVMDIRLALYSCICVR